MSSYCPPSSLTITNLRSFLCFLELLLTIPESAFLESRNSRPESMKELLNSTDPSFPKRFLPTEFLCKTKSPPLLRFILVEGSASKHKHGLVWESTTDEPMIDKAPTILSLLNTLNLSLKWEFPDQKILSCKV